MKFKFYKLLPTDNFKTQSVKHLVHIKRNAIISSRLSIIYLIVDDIV